VSPVGGSQAPQVREQLEGLEGLSGRRNSNFTLPSKRLAPRGKAFLSSGAKCGAFGKMALMIRDAFYQAGRM
jgi:hypothetical protein